MEEWRKAKEACSGGVKGEGKGRWWCAGFDAIAGGWCLRRGNGECWWFDLRERRCELEDKEVDGARLVRWKTGWLEGNGDGWV